MASQPSESGEGGTKGDCTAARLRAIRMASPRCAHCACIRLPCRSVARMHRSTAHRCSGSRCVQSPLGEPAAAAAHEGRLNLLDGGGCCNRVRFTRAERRRASITQPHRECPSAVCISDRISRAIQTKPQKYKIERQRTKKKLLTAHANASCGCWEQCSALLTTAMEKALFSAPEARS